jgi:aminopeptidase N
MAWTQCQDEDAHYFVPCLDQPGIKHPWRVTVTVDAPDAADWTVVGNGTLASRDGATWTWDQPEAIPAYLLTVVVANMLVVQDQPGDGRPVRYLVPAVDVSGRPADEAQVRRIFGRTPAMMDFLASRLGVPYPWPRYDQVIVHDFIFGGMENVAATTLTDVMLTDDRAALDNPWDDLVVHELMHQWFGDLVTCQDWSQGWLNEGWATYSEQLWKAHAEGQDEGDLHGWHALANYLAEDGGRYRRAIVSYRFREPIDVFDRHLYEKGSLVLRTLRAELGEAAFWVGVTAYLRTHAHGPVHTRDFQRAMERASGRNLDRFFQQWVLGAGHPTLKVKLAHEDGLLTIKVDQAQAAGTVADDPEQVVAEAFAFTLPVAVVHRDAAGVETVQRHRLPVKTRAAGFTLPCAEAPARVEVDPGLDLLSDLTVDGPRDWLIASLSGDSGAVGRIRAAKALAKEGSPIALRALCAAMAAEPCWGVRTELAALLGTHGGPEARAALLLALVEADPRVRRAVVEALAPLRQPEVAAALVKVAREGDPSVQVEGAALVALGGIVAQLDVADPSLLGAGLAADDLVALLREALHRPAWADVLTQRALDGLSRTRRAEVLDVLIEHSGERFPDRVRATAAQGLGRLAEAVTEARKPAVDRLVDLARTASWRVRYFSLQALGGCRDARALGPLHEVHQTALEGRLRRTAFESAARLGREAADPVAGLRDQLEKLREEGRTLRERLDKLEGKVSPGATAASVPGEPVPSEPVPGGAT